MRWRVTADWNNEQMTLLCFQVRSAQISFKIELGDENAGGLKVRVDRE